MSYLARTTLIQTARNRGAAAHASGMNHPRIGEADLLTLMWGVEELPIARALPTHDMNEVFLASVKAYTWPWDREKLLGPATIRPKPYTTPRTKSVTKATQRVTFVQIRQKLASLGVEDFALDTKTGQEYFEAWTPHGLTWTDFWEHSFRLWGHSDRALWRQEIMMSLERGLSPCPDLSDCDYCNEPEGGWPR